MRNTRDMIGATKKYWENKLKEDGLSLDNQLSYVGLEEHFCVRLLNHVDDSKESCKSVFFEQQAWDKELVYTPFFDKNEEVFYQPSLDGEKEVRAIYKWINEKKSVRGSTLCTLLNVVVNPEKEVFFTISKLRVVKFLVDQIRRKSDVSFSVKIGLKLPLNNAVNPLIIGAIFGFAAKTSGMDFITSEEGVLTKDKLNSLAHILNDETHLKTDIWKASFLMEDLTRQWIEKLSDLNLDFPKCEWEYDALSQTISGEYPYLRGPYLGMYKMRPWTIRQYAGFSTAEASNAFYKDNMAQGQKGLSVAFDLPTHRGYDSDHPEVYGDVGKAGVAIDSVEDMKQLFDGINLGDVSVSMTMNGAVLPVMAFYIVTAEEQGVEIPKLRGTLQNDILKEFMVRNTYIYPPLPSMKIVKDIISYCAESLPSFNPISISGYHMHEAGASAAQELAFTLADGLEYVQLCLEAGLGIDDFAPRLSFFWGTGMNFVDEVAKMRAGRVLWAELMQQFNPQNPKSSILRVHCQTSGWSLIAQNPSNNIVRTTLEALAAIGGHTQSLHTNALDEAIALPTPETAKIARDTQLYLQNQIGFCDVIDPFGGSEVIEKRTEELISEAKVIMKTIKDMGGMTLAIKQYFPQGEIERNATERQALIDAGEEIIVGLNKHKYEDTDKLNVLEIDNLEVRKNQVEKLKYVKESRNNENVEFLLQELEKVAKEGGGNLLEICVRCARARATLGEMSTALEKVFGRYKANTQIRTGLYARSFNMDSIEYIRGLAKQFRKIEGRQPRILVAKMGQDGHDRGAKVIASAFADMGFDVDLGPLFQTPSQVIRQAMENDVHIIGISSMAGGHKSLIKSLMDELQIKKMDDVMVVAGGIIPEQDIEELKALGVSFVFGPGTDITKAAEEILLNLLK